MDKKKATLIQIAKRDMEINARIEAIADSCETEKRSRSAAEEAEYKALVREKEILQMRAKAFSADITAVQAPDIDAQVRSLLDSNRRATITLQRSVGTPMTTAMENTDGIIPVQEQEMLKPLREKLVYNAVNLGVATGLPGTKLRWTSHNAAVAEWADEGGELTDKDIDFSKLETKPVRLGIAIPVTKELLEGSAGAVERVVREEMPKAIADAVNKALLSPTAVSKAVVGPFVAASTKNAVNFAGAVPTRKELLSMVAKVTGANIDLAAPLFVMTPAMKAELEDVKVDAGSGRFLCENDRILGYPVFTYAGFPAGAVGFGDWSYQAAGFFGGMSIVADPYTLARKNSVDFVLNTHFATETLRPEAFVYGIHKA